MIVYFCVNLKCKTDNGTAWPEPINCYFWAEYDELNRMEDGHCTMNWDGFVSNKS